MQTHAITPSAVGFDDPVLESQRTFRALLSALSRPGSHVRIEPGLIPPPSLHPAAAALCLTLLDLETPLWLDPAAARPAVVDFLRFHCGCPIVDDPVRARFVLLADASGLADLDRFAIGTPEFPDQSATVIAQVRAFDDGYPLVLRGPGIEATASIAVPDLPRDFVRIWAGNHALFPQGVDLILAAPDSIIGLPRSVSVEA